MSTDDKPEEIPPYSLEFEDTSNLLFGVVKALEKNAPAPNVSGFHLRKEFAELGYEEFLISALSLNNFLKNLKNKKPGRYPLGERKDATIDIRIASDRLSASIKITKAWGGKKLNNAKIIEAIKHNKIAQECILVSELKKVAANNDEDLEVVFAKAHLPTSGRDAELINLVSSQVSKVHDTATTDAIDQYDVYEFAVVETGKGLLKKVPATSGKPGLDVLGKVIPPKIGKDIVFTQPFEGVQLADDDENLIVASIKGHPVFSPNGVKVDPVLHLENVNIHSGNIDYDGSVFIKQNIASGFVVKATGDVHVKGQVEKARIISKGSIFVSCGILGEEDDEGNLKARLSCEGDLHARFINLAFIQCGGSVNVDEYILQSRITAKGDILVGQQKGKGRIIGGFCNSESNIKAKLLGSDAYVHTSLVLGAEENENPELNRLHADFERRNNELDQLKTILDRIQSSKPSSIGTLQIDKAKKISNTILALENQLNSIESDIQELEDAKATIDKFKVHVSGTIYPNVAISICGKGWHCEEEMRRLTFFQNRKRIDHIPLEC